MAATTDTAGQPLPAALIRGRRLATGILGIMCAVFMITHLIPNDGAAVHLIRSMAEAGMVGGLADWFAVEALFRHPLRLPIPHTALLPRNQANAARNVGRFFETHFLEPSRLEQYLRALHPGTYAMTWLAKSENAAVVSKEMTQLLGHLLDHEPSARVLVRARSWLRSQMQSDVNDAAIAHALAKLVKHSMRSTATSEVIALIRDAIDQNRNVAAKLVQDQSRWWIASAVDRRVADIVVDGVLSLLDELQDEKSEIRRDFEVAFERVTDKLATDGTLTSAIGDLRLGLLRTGTVESLAFRLAAGLHDRMRAQVIAKPDAFAAPLSDTVQAFATRILADPARREALDIRVASIAASVLGDLRPAISGYLTDVIASWDPDELSARFEAEIGPDLQYIRINGAILGALIGGILFGLNQLLG